MVVILCARKHAVKGLCGGRIKGECDILVFVMANQPTATSVMMSVEDLAKLKQRLSMFSRSSLRDFYNDAYARCALCSDRIPEPAAIQELVQGWKQLRKTRGL